MVDNLIGLLLLGLGINKGIYAPNPNIKGDTTVATGGAGIRPPPVKNAFRLHREDFEGIREGTRAATAKRVFNSHAFGLSVLKMQENFADAIEASREAAKQEFEDHKQEFRQKLTLIKDTRKQAVVDKLNTNCQNINEKRTDKMTRMLEKLSTILTNVSNRSASASAAGKETASVESAITTAQTAIADAQDAVTAQAGTTCTITITTEKNLKTDVGKVISGLQQDLKTVHEQVIAARKAVKDAVHALAVLFGEPETTATTVAPAATNSGGTAQ
jgi:hypothetical protein